MSAFLYYNNVFRVSPRFNSVCKPATVSSVNWYNLTTKNGSFFYQQCNNKFDGLLKSDTGFVFASGMFFYKRICGKQGLQLFYDDFDTSTNILEDTHGHFTLAIYKNGYFYLFNDRLGINKIFCDPNSRIFSNRWILVALQQNTVHVHIQGAFEYAWNGATFGEKTFLQEIRTVPSGYGVKCGEIPSLHSLPFINLYEQSSTIESDDDLIVSHISRARDVISLLTENMKISVTLSLSGGYDSRLLLALLLDAKASIDVFVYGKKDEFECRVVKEIAEGEGLVFNQIDKTQVSPIDIDAYNSHLESNLFLFDGWKPDGLFDDGADSADRFDRCRGGRLKVNGSAGEIYRNFFYLPDRSFSIKEFIWSFYSRFSINAVTSAFDSGMYEDVMEKEIMKTLQIDQRFLDRKEIELLYPLFRARYWTARDVPINQAFGPCFFPFLEPSIIEGTCDIPLRLKNFGVFEGRMIHKLNPRLAEYPSIYGHSFAADPPWRYRLKAQFSYRRPPFLRRYSYRVKFARLQKRPYYLERRYLQSVMDVEFPFMRHLFHIDKLHDNDVFNRVATMEYICQRFGAGLSG